MHIEVKTPKNGQVTLKMSAEAAAVLADMAKKAFLRAGANDETMTGEICRIHADSMLAVSKELKAAYPHLYK